MSDKLSMVRKDNPSFANLSDRDLVRMIGVQTEMSEDEVLTKLGGSLPPEKAPRITSSDPDIPTPNEKSQSVYDNVEGAIPELDQNKLASVRRDNPDYAGLSDQGLLTLVSSQLDIPLEEAAYKFMPTPEAKPSGLSGLAGQIPTGIRQLARSMKATAAGLGGETSAVEKLAGEADKDREANTPTEQTNFMNRIKDVPEDTSFAWKMAVLNDEVNSNPMGAMQFIAEQSASALAILAPGVVGMKTGATAGAVAGPVGAVVGGALGLGVGYFLGNASMTIGNNLLDKARLSEDDVLAGEVQGKLTELERDSGITEGMLEAAGITSVDLLTLGAGALYTKMMLAPAMRMSAKAQMKVLSNEGVNVTSFADVKKALAGDKDLDAKVTAIGEEAFKNELKTLDTAGITAMNVGMQSAGESGGAALGNYLATGDVGDPMDLALEAMAGGLMSSVEAVATTNMLSEQGGVEKMSLEKYSDAARNFEMDKAEASEGKAAKIRQNTAQITNPETTLDEAIETATQAVAAPVTTAKTATDKRSVQAYMTEKLIKPAQEVANVQAEQITGTNQTEAPTEQVKGPDQTNEAPTGVLAPDRATALRDVTVALAKMDTVVSTTEDPMARNALMAYRDALQRPEPTDHLGQLRNSVIATRAQHAMHPENVTKRDKDLLRAAERSAMRASLTKKNVSVGETVSAANALYGKGAEDANPTNPVVAADNSATDIDSAATNVAPASSDAPEILPTTSGATQGAKPVAKDTSTKNTAQAVPEVERTEAAKEAELTRIVEAQVAARVAKDEKIRVTKEAAVAKKAAKAEEIRVAKESKVAKVAAKKAEIARIKDVATPVAEEAISDSDRDFVKEMFKKRPEVVEREFAKGEKNNLSDAQIITNLRKAVEPTKDDSAAETSTYIDEDEQRERNIDAAESKRDRKGKKATAEDAALQAEFDALIANDEAISQDALDNTDEDIPFSKSKDTDPGMSVGDTEAAIADLRKKWLGKVDVKVVADEKSVPADIIGRLDKEERTGFDGLYDPKTKAVYIIADNIPTAERARWVAMHEVVGHAGLRMLDKSVRESLKLASSNRFIQQLGKEIANKRGQEYDARNHTDEAVAELAAALLTDGVSDLMAEYGVSVPVNAQRNLTSLAQRIIEAVRRFISNILGKTTDAQIRELVMANKAAVEANSTTNNSDTESRAFSSLRPDTRRVKQNTQAENIEATNKPTTPDGAIPLPDFGKWHKFASGAQSSMRAMEVFEKWAEKKLGITLPDAAKVFRSENLGVATTANKREDFRRTEVKPLIERMAKAAVTTTDLSDYMMVAHIPEANARVQAISNDPNATANGITTKEALDIKERYDTRHKNPKALRGFAREMRKMIDATLDMQLEAGLIPQSQHDAFRATFKDYVPLKGIERNRSQKHKKRFGHEYRDEFVLENVLAAREAAIVTIAHNELKMNFAAFLMEVDRDDIGTVGAPILQRTLKDFSYAVYSTHGILVQSFETRAEANVYRAGLLNGEGMTIEKTYDPHVALLAKSMLQDNEMEMMVQGHKSRIQVNNEALQEAMIKNGPMGAYGVVVAAKEFNSFLSKTYTAWSPDFVFVNPVRDLGMAPFVLTGKRGFKFTAKVFKKYPGAWAELAKSVFKGMDASPRVLKYREYGGNTNAGYVEDNEKIRQDTTEEMYEYMSVSAAYAAAKDAYIAEERLNATVANPVSRYKLKNKAKAAAKIAAVQWKKIPVAGHFLRSMANVNMVMENALRLATFEADIETDSSPEDAALLAKDLMNFNRKGRQALLLGAAYIFWNPAAQGAQQFSEAMTTSKHRHQVQALGVAFVGAAWLAANALRGGDEDDERAYRNIPQHERNKNAIIPIGDNKELTLPLSYGFGIFHNVGTAMSDLQHGVDPLEVSINLAGAAFDHFVVVGNPFLEVDGQVEIAPDQVLPTAIKIGMASVTNRDSLGRQIMPTKYDRSVPDSQTMTRTMQDTWYASVAEGVNEATGGSKYSPGWADVSPNTLRFWTTSVLGGLGDSFGKTLDIGTNIAQDKTTDVSGMPVVRKFVKDRGVSESRSAFHKAINQVKNDSSRIRKADREGAYEEADMLRDKYPFDVKEMLRFIDSTSKEAAASRDYALDIQRDESIKPKERQVMMKALELEQKNAYDDFLKHFDRDSK